MAKEKIKYGLSNVHYAVLTDVENLTYEKPKPIKGGVNLSLSAEGDSSKHYADNKVYFTTTTNNGFSGDLEIMLMHEEFLQEVLGFEKDTDTGMLVEVAEAMAKPIALLFQFENDTNSKRVVLFNVQVSRPGLDHATKTETIDPQTDSVSITVIPVSVGEKLITKGVVATEDSAYEDFFERVVVPFKSGENLEI